MSYYTIIGRQIIIYFKEVSPMNYNGKELTPEQLALAKSCKTAEELIAKAKEQGFELTQEDAEAFLKFKDEIK